MESCREADIAECTCMLAQGLFVPMLQRPYAAEKEEDLQRNQKGLDRSLQRREGKRHGSVWNRCEVSVNGSIVEKERR